MCETDSQWEAAVQHRELSPVLCDNLEGWDGLRGELQERGDICALWLTHVLIWQKPTQYCKAIILQLKKEEIRKTTSNFRMKLKRTHLVYKVFHDFAHYPF